MAAEAQPTHSLGARLIAEFGKRHIVGLYFNYQQYQELRAVRTKDEMRAFLREYGYSRVIVANDPVWLADGIQEAAEDKAPPWWTQDILGLVTIPFWAAWRSLREPPQFPRRSRFESPVE
ncbi:hypothetical protein [Lacipirellula parvula]|uniref:Uncharacterized protein n=1 Tax=Lacipirellula parvula TaxID=2650471 RepID=A0A5K7X868_9BACT|nr:hypothetical protein [Lacipirellula parvula]BBO32984.1 hypothetical protein PLANPX_2596 [Lacipirellula parvula]